MTSVKIANYGSICISEESEDKEDTGKQEEERSSHVSLTEEEETYQELLPQQESWTSRHKQSIGLFQKVIRVHSMLCRIVQELASHLLLEDCLPPTTL